MHAKSLDAIHRLSSKSVLTRKKAIREIKIHLGHPDAYLIRLSLQYLSIHDPSYTVRNIARQAFYAAGSIPDQDACWDKNYLF